MRLTLTVVGRTLFSTDVSSHADEVGSALTEVFGLLKTVLMPFSELIEKLPIPMVKRFERARDRLNRVIYGLIAERRKNGQDHGDLLSMLLLAQDEESNAQMTDLQVRDEALTLMLAGHETTANALAWTWYLLSQNPLAEKKLHEELDRVLDGRLPTFEDLTSLRFPMPYFPNRSVSIRPRGPWDGGRSRIIRREYTLRANSIVLLSPWVVHRDPRWFPDPEKFDPDRWLVEPPALEANAGIPVSQDPPQRPKFSYFPFGGGARVCIGERFAKMEGVLLLATLAQRWRLRLVPGHRVETSALITLRAKFGIGMTVEAR